MMKKYKTLFFVLLGISIAAMAFFVPAFLRLVEFLGHRIPQKDVRLDYIKGLIWAVFLGLTIFIWPVRSADRKPLLVIWSVKCLVMLFLMLFFESQYQTDSFGYFSGARHNISEWDDMYLGGPSFPVVFITWMHHHSFFNSFHAAKVTFGMIGLVAIYIFYRAAVAFLRQERLALLYIFAFFPSILFWSSILGKEPLGLLGMAIYSYGVVNWFMRRELVYLAIMLLGILFGAYLRIWMGIILSLPVLFISITLIARNLFLNAAAIFVLIPVLLFSSIQTSEYLGLESARDIPKIASVKLADFSRGNSILAEPVSGYNDFADMLLFLPKGMFTVLFRPLPGEVNNIFGISAGLENAFLLILLGLALKRAQWQKLADPIFIWALLLIAVWAAFYGFIGCNLGTICRYKLQVLPVFLGALIYMAWNAGHTDRLHKK